MPATNELLQEGRYRISQPSTHQGEEKLFEAYDTVRNTAVVVREIPVRLNRVATVSQRESLKLAFANQAKALTEIEHEALLQVHDYFSEIDRQYLVMEAIEGDSLGDLLASKRKPFSVAEVTSWADELLDALHYLHSRKPSIIHRNINPSNVKLHPSGKIKLIGVGVESGTDAEYTPAPADSDNLHYSPIEQIWPGLDPASQKAITNHYDDRSERMLKQPLDERSDIFSLGATLYFLITGVEPVDPLERSIELLEGKLDPLREPTSFDRSIPPEISDVLMKALEIKRENRYDSAVIMRQVLKTAITRVREREESEPRQQPAAGELAREGVEAKAEAARAAIRDEKQSEADAEHKRQSELMQKQLLEAEAQRVEAERNAEADRLLLEKETTIEPVAEAHGAGIKVPEDNLLEIPVAAEVVAYRDTNAVEEDDLAAVLRELEEADASASGRSVNAKYAADITFESPIDLGSQTSGAGFAGDDEDAIFSVPEKAAFSLPIPAIAGAIGLVVVLFIAGWFVLSGSSEPVKPEPVQVAQPAPAEPDPAMETIVSSQSDTNSASADNPMEPVAVASKSAATPKPKKDAAKAEKKKVTVDDLINDN